MLLKHSNLKTLHSKINIVKNTCACFREISQIVSLSTFDQRELKNINYLDKNVSRVRERVKCANNVVVKKILHGVKSLQNFTLFCWEGE